ncbi:MORN repeat-containing protein [Salix suchowensis]|nr:MORN repeat-containing protein [Salix suchowensis]
MSYLIYEPTNPSLPHPLSYHHFNTADHCPKHKRDTMRSLSLSALTLSSSLMMLLMLLSSKRCGASISLPEMDGDLPLYSIADSNLDLEFMMDSEINRILVGSSPGGYDALNSGPVFNGNQGNRYHVPLGGSKLSCGSTYKRDC